MGVVAAFAVLTVIALDVVLGKLVPSLPHEYETVDGMRDYANSDPDVLVLGSSYARSLLPLSDWYRHQAPPVDIAVVPIEGGKFYAYDWLLQRRLLPLIEEREADGKRHRPHLSRFVMVVNYYDVCTSPVPMPNLPARAWSLGDYLADFGAHGVTTYNSNYVDERWARAMSPSALVTDRGPFRIVRTLREKLRPRSTEDIAETDRVRLDSWIKMIGEHDLEVATCNPASEYAAFDRLLAFAEREKLQTTILIWPVIPKARTPEVLAVTEKFKAFVDARVKGHDIEVLDLQAANVLEDADFRPDLDHLLPSGERKVTAWALAGPLGKLHPHDGAATQVSFATAPRSASR